MQKKHIIKILLIIFILALSNGSFAKKPSFFLKQNFENLEKEVQESVETKILLKKLSEIKSYKKWINTTKDNTKLYIAIKWFKENFHPEAYQLLQSISAKNIKYTQLFSYYYASLSVEYGNIQIIGPHIKILQLKHPKSYEVLFLRSSYLANKNDLIGAIRDLNSVIKENKKMGKAYLQRGFIYTLSLNYKKALKDFEKATKYLDEDELHMLQMAYFQSGLIQLKQYHNNETANTLFKKGIALNPDSRLVVDLKNKLGIFNN